ncbi:MAG: 16S rRNA (adenine(1518)-N(6)/adenine(1519)-N(6))-dimethyltransferase RsmA [Patescibacteria group bacterium]|jgi:16S rRNA (adenine1518-N6/adenine1519-N6)-dimethyltransferase
MPSLYSHVHIQHLATKYGLQPGRTYGQNFLIDEEVIRRIITLSNADRTDTIVEIGPGFGVLTTALAEVTGRVISFEIEKKLKPYWEDIQTKFPNIEILWGNALKTFPEIAKGLPDHYKVVANLPYQITSAAIRMFLEVPHPPSKLTLMVQKEVGERICAAPGQMSLLSVSVQYYAEPHLELTVPSSAFWPPPKVDSAVVTLRRREGVRYSPEDEQFFAVVKAGFAARRKLLIKNLSGYAGSKHRKELMEIFAKLKLLPTARAQELSMPTWRELAKEINILRQN